MVEDESLHGLVARCLSTRGLVFQCLDFASDTYSNISTATASVMICRTGPIDIKQRHVHLRTSGASSQSQISLEDGDMQCVPANPDSDVIGLFWLQTSPVTLSMVTATRRQSVSREVT